MFIVLEFWLLKWSKEDIQVKWSPFYLLQLWCGKEFIVERFVRHAPSTSHLPPFRLRVNYWSSQSLQLHVCMLTQPVDQPCTWFLNSYTQMHFPRGLTRSSKDIVICLDCDIIYQIYAAEGNCLFKIM